MNENVVVVRVYRGSLYLRYQTHAHSTHRIVRSPAMQGGDEDDPVAGLDLGVHGAARWR